MSNKKHVENGMFTGRKIFFYGVKKSSLIEKIKRILERLEAEIVEQFIGVVHLVVYDSGDTRSIDLVRNSCRKRKNSSSIMTIESKKRKFNPNIPNLIKSPQFISSEKNDSHFLSHAKEKGCKIKSINEVWHWLNKYYKILIENDEPNELVIHPDPNYDQYHRVKALVLPALKIIDRFGGTRPQVAENHNIEYNLWAEYQSVDNESRGEKSVLRRRSTGASRKTRRSLDTSTGFCEVCKTSFQNLHEHLNAPMHKSFAENESNFSEIDKLIGVDSMKVASFLMERNQLWQQHKKSRVLLTHRSILPPPPHSPLHQQQQLGAKDNQSLNKLVVSVNSYDPTDANAKKSVNEGASSSSSSSSVDTSSSCSSSQSSSSSKSSPSVTDNRFDPLLVSSTPLVSRNQRGKTQSKRTTVSLESISNEENQQQSILSQHVSEIIDNLNCQLVERVSLNDDNNDSINIHINSRINNETKSPIISRRFDWCNTCSRNHVPVDIDRDRFVCQFDPLQIKIDHHPFIEVIDLRFLSINDESKSIREHQPVDIDDSIDNSTNKDNIPPSEEGRDGIVNSISHNSSSFNEDPMIDNCCEALDERDKIIDNLNKGSTRTIHSINDDSLLDNENIIDSFNKLPEEDEGAIDKRIDSVSQENLIDNKTSERADRMGAERSDRSNNSIDIDLSEKENVIDNSNKENIGTSDSCKIDSVSNIETIVDDKSINQAEKITKSKTKTRCSGANNNRKKNNKKNHNIGQISIINRKEESKKSHDGGIAPLQSIGNRANAWQTARSVSSGTSSPLRRRAAEAADQGIRNSIQFFRTNIDKTVRALHSSCDPLTYDPRIIINKVKFSPPRSNVPHNIKDRPRPQ